MKRVYKVRIGDAVCYSTRLFDVFSFIKDYIFDNDFSGSFSIDIEVQKLH